ncbi:MAG: hypothetical protein ACLTAN_08945 [Christensenellaceae bacterium]
MTISVYMGGKKLQKGEYKNYICVSDYVSELVNEVYYSKIDEYNSAKNCPAQRQTSGSRGKKPETNGEK